MANRDLLPGVLPGGTDPKVVCDSRRIVRRARRLAVIRETAQVVIVGAVDWLFIHWPATHVPFADRHESLLIVAAFNALVIAQLYGARKLPQWTARRIASTWCPAERKRFTTTLFDRR